MSALRTLTGIPRNVYRAMRAGRRGALVAVVAVIVVLGTTSALLALRTADSTAERDAAAQARPVAEQSAVTLLSYDHRMLPTDLAARTELLGGPFRTDYEALVTNVVTPSALEQQLVSRSTVVASSVVRVDSPDAVSVLLFLDQSTTTAEVQDPVQSGSRVRVGMVREEGRWLVTELTPV